MEAMEESSFGHYFTDLRFLGNIGNLVRLGLLSFDGLALGNSIPLGENNFAQFLYQLFAAKNPGFTSSGCIGGCNDFRRGIGGVGRFGKGEFFQ